MFREARSAEHQAREDLNDQTAKREKIAAERTKLERARRVIPILRKIERIPEHVEIAQAATAEGRVIYRGKLRWNTG